MNPKELCIKLAKAESENSVIEILDKAGYWKNDDVWRYYGDKENNFATIGNQQSRPETAIVEKIINSVDAVLMSECLKTGIHPESPQAPKSIIKALETFFNIYAGKLSNIGPNERKKLAENIALVSTGQKSNPCYTIIDKGEGQTPNKMPSTLLSIGESNKLRIPFVQGKFNMGGTGILQFCGKKNLQLIISKRNPGIINTEKIDESSACWGFTVVRRESPQDGVRSSVYKYLAPSPGNEVLRFEGNELDLFPGIYPEPYGQSLEYGTFIKLYEYQMTGLKTNILFDLYNRLSMLMPSIALPVRFYERRKGYSGHTFETTLNGLSVRLEEDKTENLEEGFSPPPTSTIKVFGQTMKVSIFAFKKGQTKKYTKNEGVIFTVNGQTHAYLTKGFFNRNAIRMNYIADSLLVVIDCSEFDVESRENLFMNSRDRLRSGEFRSKIEQELSDLLKNHSGLRELRTRRRQEEIENKLEDSKPLVEVIENILKKSPTLSRLFIDGVRLPNPFKVASVKEAEVYKGQRFPTSFKLIKEFGVNNPKPCPQNNRFRIQYSTDADNDYLDRDSDPGIFSLQLNNEEILDFSINLWNGIANLNVDLPVNVSAGDILHFESIISDPNRVEPFTEKFYIKVEDEISKYPSKPGRRKPPASNNQGSDADKSSSLDLPEVKEVYKDDWDRHEFTGESALMVKDSGEDDLGYDFFINMDNIHLSTEKKSNSVVDTKLLEARYKYGMVLIGIALLKDNDEINKKNQDGDNLSDEENIYSKILYLSRVVSPILLPMISGLGELQEEDFALDLVYEEV